MLIRALLIRALLGASTAATTAAWAVDTAAPSTAAEPSSQCVEVEGCVTATPEQLFALADTLFSNGDKAGAARILEAITQDKHAELRAEARFRLAAVRESIGDLAGAAQAIRDLLTEQPNANRARLELARLLSRIGQSKQARRELATAEAAGLPPEVLRTVRQFSTSITPAKRSGVSLELASGPDSNVNRATGSQYVDTIIAPFELDPDARRQSGIGVTVGGQAWTRNRIGGVDLISRAELHADLFGKSRFNDVQTSISSGPEFSGRLGTARFAALYERRWFGGHPYSSGIGGSANWQVPIGGASQAELAGTRVRQSVAQNPFQNGWRTSLSASLLHPLGKTTTARVTVRWGALDAKVKPESLRQWGGDLLLVHQFGAVTGFTEAGYTHTRSLAPLFLFGERRRDRRIDLGAGLVFNTIRLGGFSPLVRLTHTDSQAHIVLYDFQRTRLDFGATRSF